MVINITLGRLGLDVAREWLAMAGLCGVAGKGLRGVVCASAAHAVAMVSAAHDRVKNKRRCEKCRDMRLLGNGLLCATRFFVGFCGESFGG